MSRQRPRRPSQARNEANRRNSQRSTGPRTVQGKAQSAQNAFAHGLSLDILETPNFEKRVNILAYKIAVTGSIGHLGCARLFAAALLALERVKAVRFGMLQRLAGQAPPTRVGVTADYMFAFIERPGLKHERINYENDPGTLVAMIARLIRYESRAHSRLRSAKRAYASIQNGDL